MVKYQIFVSSTYVDLKGERDQVIRAVLEMGHIPVGMEMFSAADEEQWKIIARQIDESDYYVVIVGHRYGSMDGGVGFTEKEFDYAVQRGVPVLGFIVDDAVEPLAKHVESDPKKSLALDAFREKVRRRPIGFWKSADDLHGKVSIALMKAFNTTPRTGWTRTSGIVGPEVMLELSRLSSENADLRLRLKEAVRQDEKDYDSHVQEKIELLSSNKRNLHLRREGDVSWDLEVETNLFDIFAQLGPEMMVEVSVTAAASYVALMNNHEGEELSRRWPFPENHMKMILADLSSLGLIEPSKKKHPVADKEAYWSLTPEGSDVLKRRRVDLLHAFAASARLRTVAEKGDNEASVLNG